MTIKASKGSGSKLGRTETVSIRLDPRLNYLCELAARSQRRTKSSFIEATLAEQIQTQAINKWRDTGQDQPDTFGEKADVLWHVRESQRLVSLGIIAPELMTFEEQHIWALIEENGFFWRGQWRGDVWRYQVSLDDIIRDRVDKYWEDLLAVATGEKDSNTLPRVRPPATRDIDDDEIPF
ncbi:hypothetical protein [Cribrihabitans marinus]|uniref:hypothetical protein n=1 Tax=Cribrihabitans marinus TaxID=1227549 RepID=UPI00115FBA90|nr:hypothetical protein [Cribrihabitans marinus]GGH39909.1 hypothetical protein GCM10010973_36020 [Cribrihabitans marinus]